MNYKLLLLFLIIGLTSNAQEVQFEKPNYKKIEKNIKKKSNLNYDLLTERYRKSDSTMTLEEKRHLYYGYAFHEDYSPYGVSKFSDSIRKMIKKDSLDDFEFKKMIRFGDSILVKRPFDTNAINYQLFAYERLNDPAKFQKKIIQYRIIFDALFSSGDAKTKETAIYVLYTSHEYDILRIIGYDFIGQSLIGNYDYMRVKENEKGYEGFYFEVSQLLDSMAEMLKDE